RKTSLLENPYWDYTLNPEEGVNVKSRIEYIIYKKLQEHKKEFSDDEFGFSFEYEKKYQPKNRNFKIKPDFTIDLNSGKRIYLEHLGRLNSRSYERDWFNRLKIYKEDGLIDCLVTTDELNGVTDKRMSNVVEDIISDSITATKSPYSKYHYTLND
ncbi:unnamed protein product, partial [marine sediment metagenome]